MSEQETSKPNGAIPTPEPAATPAPPKSLREVAEDAYDEVVSASEETSDEPAVDAGGRRRDAQGRFVPADQAAKPGEADDQPVDPAPQDGQAQPQTPTQPPAPGSSSEAPANWSAEDRANFAKLQPEGQSFLLRRHSEMEGDYQRRVQANAAAAQFTQSLEPIFTDPQIAASMRDSNLSARDAITEWASMHRRAISPDMRDRVVLWHEIGQRMGLDPAAVYGQSQPGQQQLSEADLKDPAIKYFADHVSRTVQDVQALRGQITAMQQAEVNRTNAEATKVTRWGIDSFAEEKGQDGKPLRPDFDVVLPQIIELFSVNPERDLREAYEQARWMNPQTREKLVAAERASVQQQAANARAKQAGRLNARGVTSPVSKPPDAPGSKSLRDTLEQAADEIGFAP